MNSEPLILAEPESPFWGFGEVFMMMAVYVIAGFLVVNGTAGMLHGMARFGYVQLVQQFVAYLIIFGVIKVLFFWAGKPLLKSLAWVSQPFPPVTLLTLGLALSVFSAVLLIIFRTPEIRTPFEKLMS